MVITQLNTTANANTLFEQSEICLFELSEDGTILYCRTNAGGEATEQASEIVGRNLFDEIVSYEDAAELRRRVNNFVKKDWATEKFAFVWHINKQNISVNIMLLRVRERADGKRAKTIIVDIRRA